MNGHFDGLLALVARRQVLALGPVQLVYRRSIAGVTQGRCFIMHGHLDSTHKVGRQTKGVHDCEWRRVSQAHDGDVNVVRREFRTTRDGVVARR